MKDEYIIINKTQLLKEIEELEGYKDEPELTELKVKKQILSQSTPLIPEVEKLIIMSSTSNIDFLPDKVEKIKQHYILNLKLDI